MRIRRADINDAYDVAVINVNTWKDAYRGLIADEILDARNIDEKRIQNWRDIIAKPENQIWVCEDEEGLLGYLWAGKNRDDFGMAHEIYAFYVCPDKQKKGVGSLLMKTYQENIGYQAFYLFMIKGNKKAAKFYEKNGGVHDVNFNRLLDIKGTKIDEICYVFNRQ